MHPTFVPHAVCTILLAAWSFDRASPASPHVPARAPAPHSPCDSGGAVHAMSFTPGATRTNTFVTTADPETRKFLVHVPSTYSLQHAPYPVVYMLHGSGQTALNSVQNTTWNQAAETLEFVAVYPEALPYLLVDGTTQTKWQTEEVEANVIDPSELPMADDVVFLRELHATIGAALNVDCSRVYATGFSNGGAFVKTRVHKELADLFAATTSAGGIGLGGGTIAQSAPANGVDYRPHFEVVGTLDDKKLDNCVAAGDLQPGDVLPRHVVDVLATPCMWNPLLLFTNALSLDATQYTTSEQATFTQFRWTVPLLPGPGPREYRFRILPNMTHEYPSGTNYPTDYVPIFYAWMSQYAR